MGRLGIFGGSFCPPHLGHRRAAVFFANALRLDRVLIIPAARPPLKKALWGACADDRMELCSLTFSGDSRAWISDIELRRAGPGFTADTLRQVGRDYPGQELFLLVGADQLAKFDQWKDWRKILKACVLVVLRRNDAALEMPEALEPFRDRVVLLEGFTPLEVSSTELRARLLAGEDVSPWMEPAALAYIKEKGLFTVPPETRGACRAILEPLLTEKRLAHCERVADAAMELARRCGADPHKAMLAGMLHDAAKNMPPHRQLELCERYGKPLKKGRTGAPPQSVWHAFAGEAFLALDCGVTDPDVLSAVRWHTTGHPGMTLLEEIIFVADLISADRCYPDVGRVRALAAGSLREASRYILRFIIAKARREGHQLYPASLDWYEEIKKA
ncbi:MAG: nicotinate (nicotinamide) nucleotide adenylyltransferase [Oscillospiraceae bacterium]|nr:nicotinate (nicotinamide) nucleotide adenylyltransferase [Oscillospiraceae bacterium]